MLVDTHAHVNLKAFSEDFEAVLRRCFDLGVTVVNVGTDISTSKKAVEIMERHSQGDRLQDTLSASQGLGISPRGGELYAVYAAVGLHPSHTYDNPYLDENESTASIGREIFDYEEYKKLALHPKVVGIGECGLDYYRLQDTDIRMSTNDADNTDKLNLIKQQQKEAFLLQIKLAKELDKALIIHCRPSEGSTDAYDDLYEIIKLQITNYKLQINSKDQNPSLETAGQVSSPSAGRRIHPSSLKSHSSLLPFRFEIHSFTGSWQVAEKFLNLGGCLGFNGIITFDRTGNMEEVVWNTPLDRILLETDSPYLSPKPLRGKRNEPVNVKLVAEKIAEIKGLEYDEVVRQTTENASVFFHLD
jgi:TatD DNase family protein